MNVFWMLLQYCSLVQSGSRLSMFWRFFQVAIFVAHLPAKFREKLKLPVCQRLEKHIFAHNSLRQKLQEFSTWTAKKAVLCAISPSLKICTETVMHHGAGFTLTHALNCFMEKLLLYAIERRRRYRIGRYRIVGGIENEGRPRPLKAVTATLRAHRISFSIPTQFLRWPNWSFTLLPLVVSFLRERLLY